MTFFVGRHGRIPAGLSTCEGRGDVNPQPLAGDCPVINLLISSVRDPHVLRLLTSCGDGEVAFRYALVVEEFLGSVSDSLRHRGGWVNSLNIMGVPLS